MAGINHCVSPEIYVGIMPSYLSRLYELVIISGIFEELLLVPHTRHLTALGVVLLLIAVFPANIQMDIYFWGELGKERVTRSYQIITGILM